MVLPVIAEAGPVLVTARSAVTVVIVVVTVELLLAGVGSTVVLVTVAVFVIVPVVAVTVTTSVNLSRLPAITIPPVGVPVTRPADCVYVKPSAFIPVTAVADTNVVPVGTMSVSDTPW